MKAKRPSRIKIATYAICKNEAKHVKRWLEATKESDYRIILDTGSTDNTMELLREADNLIVGTTIVSPWRFDTARNQALALVPEDVDVCLILDMDEVPEKNFYRKVQNQWVRGADRGWVSLDTGFAWKVDRLHSRHGWTWKWPCHEALVRTNGNEDYAYCDTTTVIKHQPDSAKSRGQYETMLEEAVKEMPDDPRMWTYLCREYYFHEKWEKVLESAEKIVNLDGMDHELAAVCRWAGDAARALGQPSEPWFAKGVSLCPHEGESWLGMASDALRRGDYGQALDAAIRCFELPRVVHYLHEPSAWSWKAYDIAAQAAFKIGELDAAIAFAQKAHKGKGPETARIKRNIEMMMGIKNGLRSRT